MAMIVGMQYRPVLDLDFGRMKSLTAVVGPTPSFARASTGTYFNSSGVLTTAAINGPRFDHVYNGTSWVSKGLLIEEARTNLCTHSGNQLNATWPLYNSTVTASGDTDPAGGASAFRIAETTTSDQRHEVYIPISPSASTFTYSVFAKAQERNWLQLTSYDYPGSYINWFNLSAGVVGTNTAGNTSTITPVGNGWYRCSVTRTVASTSGQYFQAGPANGDNNGAYAGDPTKGLLIYGAQVELGAFPTSYIPTTSTQVTRSADVCQITGGDFSGFWNASEGSVVAEFDYNNISYGSGPYRIGSNPGGTYSYSHSRSSTTSMFLEGYINGSTPVYFTITPILSANKTAFGYKTNDFALSTNGASVQTDTSGATVLNISNFYIGSPGDSYLNGHIARLRYYNTRLPNAILRFFSGGSGAFQPDNISGLQFWVDASDTTTLYTDSALTTLAINDGDVVGGWQDKSGSSRNALQTDGTKKPLLKLAIQNGRNIIRYDGTNDTLEMASGYQVNPSTTFLAIKSSRTGGDDVVMSIVPSASPSYLIDYDGATSIAGPMGTATGLTNNNAYHVVCVRYGTTINRMRQDGTDGIANTPTNYSGLIGKISGLGNLYFFEGDTGEIIAYNSILSGSDILLVEAYLKAKWGTP